MIKQLISFIGKNWLFMLLAALASILIFLWVWGRYLKREELPALPIITYPELEGTTISSSTSVNYNSLQLPTQAALYSQQQQKITEDQINKIAEVLGFSSPPSIINNEEEKIYYWDNDNQFLSVHQNSREINFGHYQEPKIAANTPLPTSQEINIMFGELNKKLGIIPLNLPIIENGSRFLKIVDNFVEEVPLEEATLIEVKLTPVIDEGKAVKILSQPFITLRVYRGGSLYEFRAKIFPDIKRGEIYPLKTVKEIQLSLFTQGKIISVGEEKEEEGEQKNISSLNIKEVQFVYYISDNNPLVLPAFLLKSSNIEILLPAISNRYFLPD